MRIILRLDGGKACLETRIPILSAPPQVILWGDKVFLLRIWLTSILTDRERARGRHTTDGDYPYIYTETSNYRLPDAQVMAEGAAKELPIPYGLSLHE